MIFPRLRTSPPAGYFFFNAASENPPLPPEKDIDKKAKIFYNLYKAMPLCQGCAENENRNCICRGKGAPMPESQTDSIRPIARIHTDFAEKFGIPRQSGLVSELTGRIVMEPDFRVAEALRGIEQYSHLWLIWQFSREAGRPWHPTVRPPRLGGNTRVGVFATRSPCRPNALGLSSVRLVRVEWDAPDGPALIVAGADLLDGTPIYDIKPYLPYVDSHPEAAGGFSAVTAHRQLEVVFPPELLAKVPPDKQQALTGVLAQDPRPGYQHDPGRVYGMSFAGLTVKFTVEDAFQPPRLTVTAVE